VDVAEDGDAHGASLPAAAGTARPRRDGRSIRRRRLDVVHATALLIATMQHRRSVLEGALTRAGWQVVGYPDVAGALEHLRSKPYAAVFCDELLRGASAGGFLAWSRRLAPGARFWIVAASGNEAGSVARHRPDGVIAFPPDEATLPRPSATGPQRPPEPEASDVPLEGRTNLIGLAELVEMLALTDASGVIALDGGMLGHVYLQAGRLEHVRCVDGEEELSGVRALARLLEHDDVAFRVLPYRPPSRRTVHLPTAAALTEAARLVDERRRNRSLLDDVAAECADVLGVAAGYGLGDRAAEARGEGEMAFTLGVQAVAALKPVAGSVTHLALESDDRALAVLRFGDDHVLAALAPRGRSLVLLSALSKAVRRRAR
jgi:hypothetical protein